MTNNNVTQHETEDNKLINNDKQYKNTSNKNKSVKNIKYIHFNTIKDCNAFLNKIDKTKYKISHICCQNHGVGLLNINDTELREIEEKYLQ